MKRIKIKTIFCHVAIIAICMGVFCHGYMGVSISVYDGLNVYAQDSWEDVNQDDLVTAFRYYCKSRNLTIDGSIADALTSFTTTTFNNLCSTLGIDVNALQADLKKTVEGNLGLRFLMNQQGVLAYNRIFAEFLQNNDLSVGDEVEDKVIKSGKWFTDLDGNGCFIYVMPSVTHYDFNSTPVQFGSKYIYDGYDCKRIAGNNLTANLQLYHSFTAHVLDGFSYNLGIYGANYSNINAYERFIIFPNEPPGSYNYLFVYGYYRNTELRYLGNLCLYMLPGGNTLYLGYVTKELSSGKYSWQHFAHNSISSDDLQDTNIYVTTNNTTINNNNYNNNYTIIYNDGDYYEDDDEPSPTTPPGGGGGGGDEPGEWNPTTPTIPGPSSPDFPIIDLPDIDMPDLPSLNFSLGDLREKFPFSLPFDIIAVLNVLDGEPKAPHIEATVPIGKWYTWEIDFDFAEFDNYARLFRAFEFIGFCIGLAVFTVHFVKG